MRLDQKQIEAVKSQPDENVSARHSMSLLREGFQAGLNMLHALQQQLSTNQIEPSVVFDRIREFGDDVLALAKAGPAAAAHGGSDVGAHQVGLPGSGPAPVPGDPPAAPTQPTKGGGKK